MVGKKTKSDDFDSSLRKKTTKEISEEYEHKAPDSLLCGDEVWVSQKYLLNKIDNLRALNPYTDKCEIAFKEALDDVEELIR